MAGRTATPNSTLAGSHTSETQVLHRPVVGTAAAAPRVAARPLFAGCSSVVARILPRPQDRCRFDARETVGGGRLKVPLHLLLGQQALVQHFRHHVASRVNPSYCSHPAARNVGAPGLARAWPAAAGDVLVVVVILVSAVTAVNTVVQLHLCRRGGMGALWRWQWVFCVVPVVACRFRHR